MANGRPDMDTPTSNTRARDDRPALLLRPVAAAQPPRHRKMANQAPDMDTSTSDRLTRNRCTDLPNPVNQSTGG